MIQFSRTTSTIQSSREVLSPKSQSQYSHFRKVLKSRQKFPTSSQNHLHSEPTQLTPSPKHKISQFFQTTNRNQQDKVVVDVKTRIPSNFYSLESIPYKNYKYEKPPGTATVQEFLEQACRLGQKTGRWDKQLLIEKFNPTKQDYLYKSSLNKRSTYTSDHLIKSRKVQGPASCLETIYVAKLQLDLEDHYNQEQQNKINEIEEILQQGVKEDKTKCASQQYILNRWTRKQMSMEKQCNKGDKLPQFAHQKYLIDQSINKVIKSSSQYTNNLESASITQLPEKISFLKFDFKSKNYQKQLYYHQGSSIRQLKENYIFLNKPIIGDRVLLSLGVFESQDVVPFKTFLLFMQIYGDKKNRIHEVQHDMVTKNAIVNQVLKVNILNNQFFIIDMNEEITNQDFMNLIRILCEQLKVSHPSIKSIYQELIENYKIYEVITNNLQESLNKKQFKFIYSTNQMNIDDIIDLITLI